MLCFFPPLYGGVLHIAGKSYIIRRHQQDASITLREKNLVMTILCIALACAKVRQIVATKLTSDERSPNLLTFR